MFALAILVVALGGFNTMAEAPPTVCHVAGHINTCR